MRRWTQQSEDQDAKFNPSPVVSAVSRSVPFGTTGEQERGDQTGVSTDQRRTYDNLPLFMV